MFVGDEVLLDVGFAVARVRLANLARSGVLRGASEDACRIGLAGRLVRVHARELAETEDSAGLAIRWEVTGASGEPFPVLDADIKLTAAAHGATVLTLAGVYRPPRAANERPERAILQRATAAAIRNFLGRLAAEITSQPGPVAGAGPSPVPRAREKPQPPPNV
jgi:hypothetical protein